MMNPRLDSKVCGPVAAALAVVGLAACGGSNRDTRDASVPVPDAPPDAAPPDAFVPDAPPPPDAFVPPCVAPCLAAGVFEGLPLSITAKDGVVYVSSGISAIPNKLIGTIHAVSADGRVTTLATDQSHPDALTVDGNTLYWRNQGFTNGTTEIHEAAIMKLVAGGSPEVVLPPATPNHVQVGRSLLIDGGQLYFDHFVAADTVNRVPLAGGTVQTLARNDLRPGGVHVLPTAMALRGDNAYWISNDGSVATVPKAGGTATTLLEAPQTSPAIGGFHAMTMDDESIYFVALRFNAQQRIRADLLKMPVRGGTPTPLIEDLDRIGPVLIRDGGDIYVSGQLASDGDLFRIPITGGAPVKVATTRFEVYTVDDRFVYWAADGTVFRIAK